MIIKRDTAKRLCFALEDLWLDIAKPNEVDIRLTELEYQNMEQYVNEAMEDILKFWKDIYKEEVIIE